MAEKSSDGIAYILGVVESCPYLHTQNDLAAFYRIHEFMSGRGFPKLEHAENFIQVLVDGGEIKLGKVGFRKEKVCFRNY